MSEIKFIYTDDYMNDLRVEVTTNAAGLESILEAFESFIKAAGFVLEGCLDFVDYEANEKEVTDAYNRGYSDGVSEMTEEEPRTADISMQAPTPTGKQAWEGYRRFTDGY
jgi:hypothetical protein